MGSFDKLWVAAHIGNVHVLQQELDMGAPIEGRDPLGHTALMEACKYGHSNAVQELLLRGANPDAISMMGQSARSYASSGVIQQMLDQAAHARQLQDYDQNYTTEAQHMSQSSAAPIYPSASDGMSVPLGPEQYGLQAQSSSFMNDLGPAAASQTWPQSLHAFSGFNSRQPGQNSAGDHTTSLSGLFDQLSLGQVSAQGNLQQLSSYSNPQMLLPRDFEAGATHPQSLSQSAPGSLQAQLSSLGLASGPWSSQLSSAVSSQANSSLTSLQLHQQRNGHRPVCRYWFSGRCRYGPACRFAHPPSPGFRPPAASSAPVCRYFQSGTCRFGTACRFRHIVGSPGSSFGTPPGPNSSYPLAERSQLSELLNRAAKRS
ncbi:hypothetical protein WJX74_003574 [Apatococcus lobatus]|uniref:C3H1-type domain-containing protein n=1 Tax=Apatococcus lobatus TaxID=904363 RepID=A0AAW1RDK3_9CHLO